MGCIASFIPSFIAIGVVVAEKRGRSLPSNFCRQKLTTINNEISALCAFRSFQPNPRPPTVFIIDLLCTRKAQKPPANWKSSNLLNRSCFCMHFVRYKLDSSEQSIFLDFLHTYRVSDNQGNLEDAEYHSESNGGIRSWRRWPEDPVCDIFMFRLGLGTLKYM